MFTRSVNVIGKSFHRFSENYIKYSATMATNSEGNAGTPTTTATKHNRLATERSPYLLQHKTNPVEWYPWGEEAFKAAKEQNKLIFLSVGYSTCHWCHVMERESFENNDIAKIMNQKFINIKVDREERPDVDKVYMTFVTSLTRRGGWPMSVWLTPELKPVYGGTYFPPDNKYGQPGFTSILEALAKKWYENEEKCRNSGQHIIEELQKTSQHLGKKSQGLDIPGEECLARCFSQLSSSYDSDYGGFSSAPKFPQPSNFNFLFTYYSLNPSLDDAQLGKEMCLFSLSMMDRGGIHDHICQGFARYSTDERWHVPHFEKMLYDQSQLVMAYLDAFVLSKNDKYAEVVNDIITYVNRDLSHPSGGFYSAEDADSLPTADSKDKREGAFCVWTHDEVCKYLNGTISSNSEVKLSDVFCHHYTVMDGGNVQEDPHNEFKNQNVLIVNGSIEETASEFSITESECTAALQTCRKILYKEREKRPRPHLDDKMITAWNGMMLGSMARAGVVLGNKQYVDRALANANFIKKYLWSNGELLRAAYAGTDDSVSLGSSIRGFADDYAWVIRGLLVLYETTLDDSWLEWAHQLQEVQNTLFWDTKSSGYFMTHSSDQYILLRLKEDQDGAEPSVNSVSAGNLVRLWSLLNNESYKEKAQAIFSLFSSYLNKIPVALPEMSTALLLFRAPPTQVILSGSRDSEGMQNMLKELHNCIAPRKVILLADGNTKSFTYSIHKTLKNYSPESSSTSNVTAYVCTDFVCTLPISQPNQLKERLTNATTTTTSDSETD